MSQIPDGQGAIKSSEIYTDAPLTALGSTEGTDNLSVIQQLTQLATDSFFKQGITPFSLGFLNWDGSVLDFAQDTNTNDVYFRALQTDSDTLRTIDIVMKASTSANSANRFKNITLATGDLLYAEISHANLMSAPAGILELENAVNGGSIVVGKTVRKINLSSTTGIGQITSLLTGDGTSLFIPIAFCNTWTANSITYDDLLWCVNNNRWERDTKNMLGSARALSVGGAILNFLETSTPKISWDAEVGIQNMVTYNDSSAIPVDGTGGTVNPDFVFTTTANLAEVLSGNDSFVIEKNAVGSMQGNGMSFDVQIFAGYRSRQVVFKCLFNKLSGTYNDGDIKVYVIADPNGTPQIITPINGNVGASMGEMSATFYPFQSISEYRICFHLATTNSNTFRVALDDIKLNPIYYVTADAFGSVQPAGSIAAFGANVDPDGWMMCDGRSLNRSAYPELFGMIGTSFGTASGTTFNIPDFRGNFLRGTDYTAGRDPDKLTRTALLAGGATGNNVGSYQNEDFKSHTHSTLNYYGLSLSGGGQLSYFNGGGSTGAAGGSETRPKNVNVNYIIKLYGDRKNTVLANVRVEYTSNANTTSATSDTSAFFNGIEGQLIPNLVQGVSATRNVSFLSQIQATDTTKLQTDYASGGAYWVDAAALFPKSDYPAITILANTNNLSNQITNISNLSGIITGMSVSGTGIPAATVITNVNRTTGVVTMNNNATATNINTLILLGGISFGMAFTPSISSSTQGIITFGAGGAQPDVTWASLDASLWRWRVVKSTNDLAVEVITKDDSGVIKMYAGSSVPAGWLECNGQSLLRSAYPELFLALNTRHGSADSLHFNVPDMRGMVVKGDTGFSAVNVTPSSISGQNITIAGHPFNRSGIPVQLSGIAMPSPLATATDYYVIVVDANTIRLALNRANALAGTAVTMVGTNANAITITQFLDVDLSTSLPMTTGATYNSYQESAFGIGTPGIGGSYNESGVFLRAMLMKYIIKV
jgi:microcystin-dependent protein